jgi:competence protein ComEC
LSSIGWAVPWLLGCASGLMLMSLYPSGLSPVYGAVFLLLAILATFCALLLRGGSSASVLPLRGIQASPNSLRSGLVLVGLLAGCGRTLLVHAPVGEHDLAYYNSLSSGPVIAVAGVVADEPVIGDRWQRIRVSAETIKSRSGTPAVPVSGDMYAIVSRYPTYNVDERVALTGTLTVPPRFGTFDYAAYLVRQGVYSYMTYPRVSSLGPADTNNARRALSTARSRVRDTLRRAVPEPEAALAVGVVTGDRSSIPSDIQQAFQTSGTTHVLAISGENITLLSDTSQLS